MAYSENVQMRARARLDARRQSREDRHAVRVRAIYDAIPRIAVLDRKLAQTVPQVIAAAFRHGTDPQRALETLRKENQALQVERAELLLAHGYPENALEDLPICPACGDSGWCGATMCHCLKAFCTEEQIAELSSLLDLGEQSFSKFRLDFYDPPYRPRMERILEICKDYANKFGHATARNLFLCGGTGLGKTFLSACIAREVSVAGYSVVYDTAVTIFARFEEQKFSRNETDSREARSFTRKYLRCDLLILDDLGSELTTPFVQSALYQVVNTRMAEGRHTVISSNLVMAEVRARYTPQIASRLDGEYRILPFEGRDIRLIKNGIQKSTG